MQVQDNKLMFCWLPAQGISLEHPTFEDLRQRIVWSCYFESRNKIGMLFTSDFHSDTTRIKSLIHSLGGKLSNLILELNLDAPTDGTGEHGSRFLLENPFRLPEVGRETVIMQISGSMTLSTSSKQAFLT